ncbi:acyl--CoA ligase [Paenibacillus sp. JNUCC32]|uniref:class I adenylate-forming enzyme family protein n=1 Tax=Paenibacillus sp. JNUCC32 TaxID=2777984 RepID=UPI00178861FE|nr:class I adenylate-forming enzyme family protein [Paenibacillus sp. JNUCC-32]QOT08095.1 acyl--CoA ligase [Paenibacillus sp. JNUCC-32]
MKEPLTVIQAIYIHSKHNPHKVALIKGEKTITYCELYKNIVSASLFLTSIGVYPGAKIVLSASNSLSFIYGYFATHLLGAISVPIDPNITKDNFDYIIRTVLPQAIFMSQPISNSRSIEDLVVEQTPKIRDKQNFPDCDTVADIMFTTGTTGKPKGVVLTHSSIISTAKNINMFIGNGAEDVEVVPLPLSHSFGLGRLRCNMLSGSTLIITDGFLDLQSIIMAINKWNATGFSSVPTGLSLLFNMMGDRAGELLRNLNYIEIGSSPMTVDFKKELMRLLPTTRICMHYGLTEASRSAFIEFHSSSKDLDSIGKPVGSIKMEILDDKGNILPDNKVGHIAIQGSNVMKEYFNNDRLTKESFVDGWFLTGDMGFKNKEGFFYLFGRKTDIINVGGRKVSPAEVEEALIKHPHILDCACIGVADPDGFSGEVVKACLVGDSEKISVKEIAYFLKGKIESYKIPQIFEWVDSIPKTNSGKIKRYLLKK